jgi:UDP-N-acetylmuramate dehydrogenase
MKQAPQPGVDLSYANTLGIPAAASWFAQLTEADDLPELVRWAREQQLTVRALGGGSNLVLSEKVSGLVVKIAIRGKTAARQTGNMNRQRWRLGAGESWHETVVSLVRAGYSGIENLALIPGTVGAAPVQNIGAYGVELSDSLYSVDAYDTLNEQWLQLSNAECRFGYRDSVFKQQENRYIITAVELELYTDFQPKLTYGPLQQLAERQDLTALEVMEEVIAVRQSRLPDPELLPNAGSFFKNPIIDRKSLQALVARRDDLVVHEQSNGWKVAAGWLIDQCGLRGQSSDEGVGCYERQALVLINPLRASAASVMAWQQHIQRCVQEEFGVLLEPEPRFWD